MTGVASATPTGPVIEASGLVKRYGSNTALDGLSLRVEQAEIFGFLGPNGAGKTTAVKLLLGMTRPTDGSGRVLGRPLGHVDARRRVGYLPELFRYQPWLSAAEVLRLHCELAGVPRSNRAAAIDRSLDRVGLTERAGDRVGTFSKGMQQRLGLGVALLGQPRLVFLDEPTSALDPVGRLDVRRIVADLKAEGVAVFLDSHLLGEVERVCDRVAIVDHGRVIAEMTIDELSAVSTLRIRVTGLPDEELPGVASVEQDGWRLVTGAEAEDVPRLVADLVARGGEVHAVVPGGATLEERFLQLLGRSA